MEKSVEKSEETQEEPVEKNEVDKTENVDYSQFDNISEQLTGVSRNINQIAKRINATDTVYAGDMREIKQKQEEIWQLLNSIESQLL